MKPTKCPAKEKKWGKKIKRWGEKAKSKNLNSCITFKTLKNLEILLSAHTRTSQANILHLDQKGQSVWTVHVKGFVVSFSSS